MGQSCYPLLNLFTSTFYSVQFALFSCLVCSFTIEVASLADLLACLHVLPISLLHAFAFSLAIPDSPHLEFPDPTLHSAIRLLTRSSSLLHPFAFSLAIPDSPHLEWWLNGEFPDPTLHSAIRLLTRSSTHPITQNLITSSHI